MEQATVFVNELASKYPILLLVLSGMGSIIPIASAYIVATPGKEDDAWWDKLEASPVLGTAIRFFMRFSLLSRKEPAMKLPEIPK